MKAAYKRRARMAEQLLQKIAPKHAKKQEESTIISESGASETKNLPPSVAICASCPATAKGMSVVHTNMLPVSLPVTDYNRQRAEKVNGILTFSLVQQIKNGVSDSPGFVVIVISRCLGAIGVKSQIRSGLRHTNEGSSPHVWLDIDGYVIDNTFSKDLRIEAVQYLFNNAPICYEICEFSCPESHKMQFELDNAADAVEKASIIKRNCFNFYTRKHDKTLALGLNKKHMFNYYFAMIRHLNDVYGVSIIGIDPKIRFMCWRCELYPESIYFLTNLAKSDDIKGTKASSETYWKFRKCGKCMVANYCSFQCQRDDWGDNHNITCLSRGSGRLPPLSNIPLLTDPPKKVTDQLKHEANLNSELCDSSRLRPPSTLKDICLKAFLLSKIATNVK